MPTPNPVVLFDGVCNLCNATVDFVLRRDRRRIFRVAPLQSEPGAALLRRFHLPLGHLGTVVLIEGDRCYTKSAAALRILRRLNWPWPVLYGLILIPPLLRNALYAFIAQRRYAWFGQRPSCRIPSPEEESRFLE